MIFVRLVLLFSLFLSLPLAAQDAESHLPANRAAEFLVAMQTDASAVRKLATQDSIFVAGDIGGPFSELLRHWSPFRDLFLRCKIAENKFVDLAESDRNGDDAPSWPRNSDPTIIKGTFVCDVSKRAEFTMMTRKGLVSYFGLWWVQADD